MKESMEQVGDFFSLYKNFAWEKNSDSMIKLYDENAVVFDMWNKGYYAGLTEWSTIIRQWLGSLKEERVNVIFDRIKIQSGENVGFASSIVTYQAISSDNTLLRSMQNRITLGFEKTGNTWKVAHQHTSAPINADLQAILQQ